MIDDATIKKLTEQCGLNDSIPLAYADELLQFARAIEQLARAEQRESDARICDYGAEVAPVEQQRVGAARCATAIRANTGEVIG